MHYLFFSKMVREQTIPQLIETLRHIGADGVDLAVRPGYPVNPANVRTALPAAAKQMRDAGLVIPMVTAPTDMNDAGLPYVEDLWAACHDARIPNVKLGYWSADGGGYWSKVDAARKQIAAFEKLATRFGVKACLHTHSGNYLGLNASSVMHLARDFNPAAVGVYLDPGHLAVNGEPLTMAFDIAGDYLALVAVKDSKWVYGEPGRKRRAEFVNVGEGSVDWREMMRALRARAYDGPLSFHSEYDGRPVVAIIEQTRRDIAFMRGVEKEAQASTMQNAK